MQLSVERLPSEEIIGAHGMIELWCPAPGVFASRASGHFSPDLATACTVFGNRVLAMGLPMLPLHDWSELTGYETQTRRVMTSWSLEIINQFEQVHIAIRSRMVKMGVSVVNLALGGKIHVHLELDTFLQVYDETVARRRDAQIPT